MGFLITLQLSKEEKKILDWLLTTSNEEHPGVYIDPKQGLMSVNGVVMKKAELVNFKQETRDILERENVFGRAIVPYAGNKFLVVSWPSQPPQFEEIARRTTGCGRVRVNASFLSDVISVGGNVDIDACSKKNAPVKITNQYMDKRVSSLVMPIYWGNNEQEKPDFDLVWEIKAHIERWKKAGKWETPNRTDVVDFMVSEASEALQARLAQSQKYHRNNRLETSDLDVVIEAFDTILMALETIDVYGYDVKDVARYKLASMTLKRGLEAEPVDTPRKILL